MFFKVLTKTALLGGAGGAGGAVYLTNSIDADNSLISNKHKIAESSLPKQISKLEDISIYEDFYGCKFVFIESWSTRETYGVDGFLKKHENEKSLWENRMISGSDSTKDKCKTQKVVMLSFYNRALRYFHG